MLFRISVETVEMASIGFTVADIYFFIKGKIIAIAIIDTQKSLLKKIQSCS